MPGNDPLQQPADSLDPLRAEDLGCGGVRDVDRPGNCDLPVEQLVDPYGGQRLGERAADIGQVEQRQAVRQFASGRPFPHAVVEATDPAGRAEHDALMVELGRDQPPALVLLAHQPVHRHPHVRVVGRVDVVRAVAGDDRRP